MVRWVIIAPESRWRLAQTKRSIPLPTGPSYEDRGQTKDEIQHCADVAWMVFFLLGRILCKRTELRLRTKACVFRTAIRSSLRFVGVVHA